jgi:hypothetical protein
VKLRKPRAIRHLPIHTEGVRLLFQVIADGYEKRSLIITTDLEFSRLSVVRGESDCWLFVVGGELSSCR